MLREATVGPLLGTTEVSWRTTSTSSNGIPSRSATIWAKTVRIPWPISVWSERARTRPSAVSSTAAMLARYFSPPPVKPAPCQPIATPIPGALRAPPAARSTLRAAANAVRRASKSLASSAAARVSRAETLSRSTCWVGVRSPSW